MCAAAGTQLLRGEGRKTTGEVLVGWAAGGLALGRVGKFAPGEPLSVLFSIFFILLYFFSPNPNVYHKLF